MNSLIITFYKNFPALDLIFLALAKQSVNNFEVIIAEDAEDAETKGFMQRWRDKKLFTIKHVSQPDIGFRKTKILNAAVAASTGDYLIFLDGDCIPHRHFVRAHIKTQKEGYALFGRRVMLPPTLTKKILSSKNLRLLNPLSMVFARPKRWKYSLYLPFVKQERKEGIWGCNWSVAKENLLSIGGFDEDFVNYGFEDTDIEWRLKETGTKLLSIRYSAIVYHLHHTKQDSEENISKGRALLEDRKKQRQQNNKSQN